MSCFDDRAVELQQGSKTRAPFGALREPAAAPDHPPARFVAPVAWIVIGEGWSREVSIRLALEHLAWWKTFQAVAKRTKRFRPSTSHKKPWRRKLCAHMNSRLSAPWS